MESNLIYEVLKSKLDLIFKEELAIQNKANDLAIHLRICKCCDVNKWHALVDKQILIQAKQNQLTNLAEIMLPDVYFYLFLCHGINHADIILNNHNPLLV